MFFHGKARDTNFQAVTTQVWVPTHSLNLKTSDLPQYLREAFSDFRRTLSLVAFIIFPHLLSIISTVFNKHEIAEQTLRIMAACYRLLALALLMVLYIIPQQSLVEGRPRRGGPARVIRPQSNGRPNEYIVVLKVSFICTP